MIKYPSNSSSGTRFSFLEKIIKPTIELITRNLPTRRIHFRKSLRTVGTPENTQVLEFRAIGNPLFLQTKLLPVAGAKEIRTSEGLPVEGSISRHEILQQTIRGNLRRILQHKLQVLGSPLSKYMLKFSLKGRKDLSELKRRIWTALEDED